MVECLEGSGAVELTVLWSSEKLLNIVIQVEKFGLSLYESEFVELVLFGELVLMSRIFEPA